MKTLFGKLIVVLCLLLPQSLFAAAPIVYVSSDAGVLVNQNAGEKWPIASITKLMTAMVLHDMNLDWNKPVVLTRGDEVGGARLRVSVGSKYRRVDLLHASLMGSANNATYALARTSGLTIPQFVARMNAKAKSLGMHATRFTDPTGIRASNISTAQDVERMIRAAYAYPQIREVVSTTVYEMKSIAKKPKLHTIKTTNSLLMQGEPVALAKTGYLTESKYNFAMLYKMPEGDLRCAVVLGAPSMQGSIQTAKQYVTVSN